MLFKNNVKCHGHLKIKVIMLHVYNGFDLSNNVCEYEVNRLITKKVIIVNDAARPPTFPHAHPPSHPPADTYPYMYVFGI